MTRQKVTFIFGPQGSGKTGLLKHLLKGKKTAGISPAALREDSFIFYTDSIKEDTEAIFMDEVNPDIEFLNLLTTAEDIVVRHKPKQFLQLKRPPVFITSQTLTQKDITPRGYFDFYNCIRYDENTSSVIYTDGTGKEQSIIVDRFKNGERANAPQ